MNIKLDTKYGTQSEEAEALPFSPLLPTDMVGLLRWRIYVRERCLHDPDFRKAIWEMCAADLPFFVLTFGWMHETRDNEAYLGEFIALLDPDQIDILAWLQKYAGRIEMTIEKTRGIGLSYLVAFLSAWCLIFDRGSPEIGLLSKDEESLDQFRRPSTLFGKIDLVFEKLPSWVTHDTDGKEAFKRNLTDHRYVNNLTNAALFGLVPTNDKTRSGRYRFLIVDEGAFLPIEDQKWLASAYGTTNSTIWISTHNGTATLFYKMTRDEDSDLVRISTWWWENRRCRLGLYRVHRGEIDILDQDYKFPPDYFHQKVCWQHQGCLRSPWVDRQFKRPGIDASQVFQELYGLAGAESRSLLRKSVFAIINRTVRHPMAKGDYRDGLWIDDPDGPIWAWFNPDRPPGPCALGVDPALSSVSGAYAALVGFSLSSGEQLISFRDKSILATDMPDKAVELARWLAGGGALPRLAFESQGVGVIFATGVERLKYPAVGQEPGKSRPGYGNPDRGAAWLLELGRAVTSGEAVVRDERLLEELRGFEYDQKWDLVYALSDGHGDLSQAAGLAWHEARRRRQAHLRKQRSRYNLDEQDLLSRRANFVWSDQFKGDKAWR